MRGRRATGSSLVDLLVGCALGLLVTAAALPLFARQVQAQREQLVEARLHQDLRAVSDLVVRGLRRAGHHAIDEPAGASPYRAVVASAAALTFSHTRDPVENGVLDDIERAGFRLADGAMQVLVGGRWQALTDPAVVTIVRFDVALAHRPAAGPGACPALVAREVSVAIEGHPSRDPQRRRSIHARVALRNDDVDLSACAPTPPGAGERSRS